MNSCPCGSGSTYETCCQPLINGASQAETAEQLMRSRYSAYVKVETDYILETTHPEHRQNFDPEGTKQWAEQSVWDGLEIVSTEKGGAADTDGTVEFIARFREKGVRKTHHELAEFKKDAGRWFFTDGSAVPARPLVSSKVGRNDPCPCGSGQKYKKCCGK
ncbi:SEC-C motif domain protein [Geotalea daltonii FRC-32]|uniref:SEC-C motif domain protein n=1 Tax=Geotalea daltonii (strain DSM 22248 / JCM 15807 / FRC-32) TaxID=316067 RepID=B9M335_GEODF|nr:YchJ family protein [Geotalea daltonii]ACM19445.1 SEC-C motif domain protein [Geotalea daltonii FRC-32]